MFTLSDMPFSKNTLISGPEHPVRQSFIADFTIFFPLFLSHLIYIRTIALKHTHEVDSNIILTHRIVLQ